MIETNQARWRFPRSGSRPRAAAVLAAATWLVAAFAQAQPTMTDPEREEDYVRVVQPQPFTRGGRGSFAPTFGMSLNDPLVQTFTVGGDLSYYFRDWIGITAGFQYAFDAKRAGQNALSGQQIRAEVRPMKWAGTLAVEWIPIYGKFAFFNRGIVHWDAFLVAGAGVVNQGASSEVVADPAKIRVSGLVGVGTRLFVTPWMAVIAELRDFIYQESVQTTTGEKGNFINNMIFHVGLSFFFPRAARSP
jgi:outer membrane beta-barrel protein